MDKFTFLSSSDLSTIENIYQKYLTKPESVDRSWQLFFEGFEFSRKNYSSIYEQEQYVNKEFKVINLINGYRSRGHLFTKTNPVRERRKYSPTLDIENFGLSENDLNETFQAGNLIGIGPAKLKDIIEHLKQTYCSSIGVEFMYIRQPQKIEWLQKKMESTQNKANFDKEHKICILKKLNQSVSFEQFLHTKFTGQKRFSIEGAESLIPALDTIVHTGADMGIKEFVLCMTHRGRLNVLANFLHKPYKEIFSEFDPKEFKNVSFDGDVKYHLGYSSERIAHNGQKVYLTLSPNPSHLESVDAVVEGIARALIDSKYKDYSYVCPILIHGDAAIAAQGVVYEVIQMSKLDGYKTGGTIHVVINNQLGFTTNYLDGRSSTYCTDVGKVTLSPVFHVNGDDAEAVVYTIQLAMEYRQKFNEDVFVDLLCYRRYGHNEGDEPRFTQPILYKIISKHPNPKDIYIEKLKKEGLINDKEIDKIENDFKNTLEKEFEKAKKIKKNYITNFLYDKWKEFKTPKPSDFEKVPVTSINKNKLIELGNKITSLPKNKKFFRKIVKLMKERREMINDKGELDWAMGELLAYASLLDEGYPVRLSGQDSERGTFAHRHAVLKIEDSEEEYVPLQNISKKQAPFYIYNSLLSEYAVLGFEYGYSLATPNGLTIWEAQFGDFANEAQVLIDQYISSGEDKWDVKSGLVLLLPHGDEGQGPEHSSARIERFLELAAEYNMQIVNCTTPANFFHVLRRQIHRNFRKPLIVFTPKSLLRHPRCISKIEEFTNDNFMEIIDDKQVNNETVDRVLLCSGKIYYELLTKKEELNANEIAIIRLEQIYPFPFKQLYKLLIKYKNAKEWLYVQEEPENMGVWPYLARITYNMPEFKLKVISKPESASPASGSAKVFEKRQKDVIEKAFKK